MQTEQSKGIINQQQKQLFKLDVRSNIEDIGKRYTAHDLKKNIIETLKDKDVKVLQLRFGVGKRDDISKFEQNFKNKKLPEQSIGFNQINGNKFIDEIFGDLRVLNKKGNIQQKLTSELKEQSDREIKEAISSIDQSLENLMQIYLSDKDVQVKSNNMILLDIPEKVDKIKMSMIIYAHPKTYEEFKNYKIQINNEIKIFLDHPRGNKDIERAEVSKIKLSNPVEYCRFGTFDSEQTSFASYFDLKQLKEKLQKTNITITMPTFLMRDNLEKVKKFDVHIDLFDKIGIKAEIHMAQIDSVVKCPRFTTQSCLYYIKMKYPVRWNMIQFDTNVYQDINFIRDWKRVENFPILRNKHIRGNEFFRLHLINNTVLEISIAGDEHQKANTFLQSLFAKYNIPVKEKTITSLSFERFQIKLQSQTNKFKDILLLTDIDRHQIWKIKYYILCLVSKNYLSAENVNSLITLIQGNAKKSYVFMHLFEKICAQDKPWTMKQLTHRFQESQNWPVHLLKSYTEPSGEAVYIWRVNISPSGFLYSNKAPEMQNRLLRQYSNYIEHFIRCNLVDDNGETLKNSPYITRNIFRKSLDEIDIEDWKFIPLGWSPSQLRKFSLWYVHEHGDLTRNRIINFLGDFNTIKPFAKMAARIGQAFSSSWCYEIQTPPNLKLIPDISTPNPSNPKKPFLFTDGIGKISEDLLDIISLKLKIPYLSVIQIRYKGAKGLLTLDTTLPKNTICLRPSMVKYECNDIHSEKYLDILSWNMYKGGFLNRQIIILLSTRGIPDEVFMTLQKRYIVDIQKMSYRECTIYKELTDPEGNETKFNLEPANKIIRNLCQAGFELDTEPFFKGILKILKRNGYQKLLEKSNINVDKSARLVGVIDEHKVLRKGEVYCCTDIPPDGQDINEARVRSYLFENSKPHTIAAAVIVVRNPCLHPGDIRKLQCISEEQILMRFREKKLVDEKGKHPFSRFANTVIFSQQGDRPVTCEISGSDLDGDNFFICWDPDLIPKENYEPHIISDVDVVSKQGEESKKGREDTNYLKNEITNNDYVKMLEFFVDYMNYDKLGKIANSHLVTADRDITSYANNPNCIKLAIAHGNAVDFPKSGYCPPIDEKLFVNEYPDFMEKDDGKTYLSKSVLGELYRDIKNRIETLIEKDDEMKQQEVYLDESLCIRNKNLEFSEVDIKEALMIIRNFNQDLDSIIYLFGLVNQFEIYSGNITSSKGKIAKQSKPIQHIVSLKSTYTKLFFEEKLEMTSKQYFEAERSSLTGSFFSEAIQQKAQLWYVLSYSEFFQDLKYSDMGALNNFRQTVEKVKQRMPSSIKIKFIGLVWFTIPKVLIDIKIGSKRAKTNKLAGIVEDDDELID